MRDPTRQQQRSTISQSSVGSAWTPPPTVGTWRPATSTSSLLWRGHWKGAVLPQMKTLKQPYGPRTQTFTNRDSSSSWSGTNASMSVGTPLKNSRLMSPSAHIGVYLVHAVSCRWRTRGTYFPTIPRKNEAYITLKKPSGSHIPYYEISPNTLWLKSNYPSASTGSQFSYIKAELLSTISLIKVKYFADLEQIFQI
jgi:hypothetical protein